MRNTSSMGTEFQFCKTKNVLKMDSGDGCPTLNVLNGTEL